MKLRNDAQRIIEALEKGDVYAECPCCSEPIRLRDAGLFHLDEMTPKSEEVYQQRLDELTFSRISQELTRPTDREYITGMLKWGDSAAGAGIRGVPGKANSYPS